MPCKNHVQPQIFQKMRADLASMWSTSCKAGNTKRICARANLLASNNKSSIFDYEGLVAIDEDVTSMKVSYGTEFFFFFFCCCECVCYILKRGRKPALGNVCQQLASNQFEWIIWHDCLDWLPDGLFICNWDALVNITISSWADCRICGREMVVRNCYWKSGV